MSIQLLIDSHCRQGTLRPWEPLLPGRHMRIIHIASHLYEEIMGATSDTYRMGLLRSDLDHFCSGGIITVGHGRESTCRMKPLDPSEDEVWEMRSRDPEPQVRVFGRFCAPDVFCATNAEYRPRLGDRAMSKWHGNNWPAEILRCKRIWEQLFPGQTPHAGNEVNDYITTDAHDLDKLS